MQMPNTMIVVEDLREPRQNDSCFRDKEWIAAVRTKKGQDVSWKPSGMATDTSTEMLW